MPELKVDWDKLKTEYIVYEFPSLAKFARHKDISYKTLWRHTKGWKEAREAHRADVDDGILQETKRIEVMTAGRRAEVMSQIDAGMINQWLALYAVFERNKEDLKAGLTDCSACGGVGRFPTGKTTASKRKLWEKCTLCKGTGKMRLSIAKQMTSAMKRMREIEDRLVEMGKHIEVLSGRASERIGDEESAEIQEMERRFNLLTRANLRGKPS